MIRFGLEVKGAGLAMALTCFLMWLAVTVISHQVDSIKVALFMPSRNSFEGWGEYLAISLPATAMQLAEWWYCESVVLIGTFFGVTGIAVQTIGFNIIAFIFMFPLGCQEAIASMVGSAIGANNVALSKKISKVTFVLGMSLSLSICGLVLTFRSSIANFYTQDE